MQLPIGTPSFSGLNFFEWLFVTEFFIFTIRLPTIFCTTMVFGLVSEICLAWCLA